MASAGKVDGQDKVIATAQQIVKSLATSKNAAEDMIRILSGFDNRLSSMNELLPTAGAGSSSLTGDVEDGRGEFSAAGDSRLESAEEVIHRWETSDSLLWEASADEAVEYLDAVDELVSLLDSENYPEELSARAEIVLQIAMARLEDEFRHLMVRNTVPLNADSLHSSIRRVSISFSSDAGDAIEDFEGSDEEQHQDTSPDPRGGNSISDDRRIELVLPDAVSDLKEIANRMIWAGYGKELCQVYSSIRRDILDECLSILGLERISIEEVQRSEWRALDEKMKKWIQAMKVMIRILLTEEKRLSEQVFAVSDDLKEECFTGASKACILQLLNFGDAVSICRRSSEKLFRILDMYETLADVIPELHSLFSAEAKVLICDEAEGVLKRLGDSVRGTFMEFAKDVQKEVSRKPLPGGEVHPLTRYVMNYVKLFVDYRSSLDVLLAGEDVLGEGVNEETHSAESVTPLSRSLLMLMSFLESNLDEKSKHYDDNGLQCIFLMNNTHYMVQKVRDSELLGILGDNWVRKHRAQVKQYATSYLRASWTKILSYFKDDGLGGSSSISFSGAPKLAIKERFKSFNLAFEEIYRTQTTWKVPDPQLRDDLCISILERVIPAYRAFLGRFGGQLEAGRQATKYIKYTPEELENFISDFFEGLTGPSNHPRRKLSS